MRWAVKVRSEIVGHSGTRTTEQIYDHADTEDSRSHRHGVHLVMLAGVGTRWHTRGSYPSAS
jgi:hypothetical protein